MTGSRVGRYEIVARLGSGGMGDVYLARDPSLDRKVALKLLPATHEADESARRRLIDEALAAARLDHPFICKVYEAGESDGRPFIAMEYVEGTPLRDRLAGGPLPLREAIRLAAEIAEALDFAHRRGVVHRDVKPSNVMVAADGHAKVLDFGVAKVRRDRAALGPEPAGERTTRADHTLTASAHLVGTMTYMAPEQLRGGVADVRSDVFAFGLLFHEMLAGAHPFRGPTSIETAEAILNAPAPALESVRPDVPPLVAHIVGRCLEKEPDLRYQTLRDVQIELALVTEGSGSTARRLPAPGRSPRRRLAAAAAVGLLAAGVAGAWYWTRASAPALAFHERDWILIADFENLTGDGVFDRSLRLALEVGIAQSSYVNVFPPHSVQAVLQRMQRAPDARLDETLAVEIAVREGLRAVLACSIAQVGDTYMLSARLVDPRSRAAVLTESVQARGRDEVLPGLDELSRRLRRRLGESLAAIEQAGVPLPHATTRSLDALKLYADSFAPGADVARDELLRQAIRLDPDFALAHAELGRRLYLESDRARREQAEAHVKQALALLDRLTERERLWIQASTDDARGLRARAADGYRAYLTRYRDDARGWFRLGWTLLAGLGQYEAAIEAFERAIALQPRDAPAHINLATAYAGLRRDEQAVEVYGRAFALRPELLTEHFVNHEYGFTLVRLGRLEEAERTFARMKAETEPSKQARGHRSQALLEMYRGRYAASLDELQQAIAIDESHGFGVSEFRDRLFLVQALDGLGRRAEAGRELAAVDRLIARLSLGPEWLRLAARVRARRGDVAAARRLHAAMAAVAGQSTVDSSANRDVEMDQVVLTLVEGEIALAEQRSADAVRLLEGALAAWRRNRAEALEAAARAHAAAGDFEKAAKRYEELLAAAPLGGEDQDAWLRAHLELGRIYDRLGRSDAARRSYGRLADLWKAGDPDLIPRREVLARVASRPAA
jgi:tetratricopeptide (TPR) repeat protein/predicted Ser/Thr protein kinase